MKRIMFVFVMVTIGMLDGNVFAQQAASDSDDETGYKDVTIEVVGEGPDEVIEIPYVVQRVHEVKPAAAGTVVVKEDKSDTSLRGGVGYGYTYLLGNDSGGMVLTDMVGQIGFRSSPWRVRARAGFGKGRYETLAVAGSLATMYYAVPETLAVGVGFDLLGTINKNSHPRETWNEQFYGPSVRIAVEGAGLSLEGFVSFGVRGTRAPGDTPEEYATVTGFKLFYLWGK